MSELEESVFARNHSINKLKKMKSSIVIILFTQLLNFAVQGQSINEERKNLVDGLLKNITVKKNIVYTQERDSLKLDIYYPKQVRPNMPCIVWIHGGGLTDPNLQKDYDIVRWGAACSALNGFVAVSIDYRLTTEAPLPAAIQDCFSAIRFLKANAQRYSINPEQIGIAGESSGGYLSVFVSLAGHSDEFKTKEWSDYKSTVKCGVGWYAYPKHQGLEVFPYLSDKSVPLLLIHGDKDTRVPIEASYRIFEQCKNVGIWSDVKVIKNARHGFFDDNDSSFYAYKQHMDEAIKITLDFFKEKLLID